MRNVNSKKMVVVFLFCAISLMLAPQWKAFQSFDIQDRCFLLDKNTVIYFSKIRSEILYITWHEEYSEKVIYKYTGEYPYSISDIRILPCSQDCDYLTWVEKFHKETSRISSIALYKNGGANYSVIIEDDNLSLDQPLKVLYLGNGSYRFFYGDSSELHIRGMMHLENYIKIKTFLYKDGKAYNVLIINKKGRFSIEDYDVRQTDNGGFQLVWSQKYWDNRKHEIYTALYDSDCSPAGKPKRLYVFNDEDEKRNRKIRLSITSKVFVEYLKQGAFIGRYIWYTPDQNDPNSSHEYHSIFETNLFDFKDVMKQSYRTDYSSFIKGRFSGYWEEGGMSYFLANADSTNKEPYGLEFNAVSISGYISKHIYADNHKNNKARKVLWVHSKPDGFFYWLEVDENGKIQLRYQPVI